MAPTPNLHDLTAAAEIPPALLERTETDLSSFLEGAQPIVEAVRREGDAALQRFAREFDKIQIVAPGAIVQNNRLGAAFAFAPERQVSYPRASGRGTLDRSRWR